MPQVTDLYVKSVCTGWLVSKGRDVKAYAPLAAETQTSPVAGRFCLASALSSASNSSADLRVFAHTFPPARPAQVWLEGCSLLFPRVLWVSSIAIKGQAARELTDLMRSDSRRAQRGSRAAEVSFGPFQFTQLRIEKLGQGLQSTYLLIDPVCLQAQAQPATTRPPPCRPCVLSIMQICTCCGSDQNRYWRA